MNTDLNDSWANISSLIKPWCIDCQSDAQIWNTAMQQKVSEIFTELLELSVSECKEKFSSLEKKIATLTQKNLLYKHFYLSLIEQMLAHKLVHYNLKGGEELLEVKVRSFLSSVNDSGCFPSLSSDDGLIPALVFVGKFMPLETYHVEVGGIPRSIFLRMNMQDKLRAASYLMFKMRGLKPVLNYHLPRITNKRLTVNLVSRDYMLSVKLLEANKHLKGVFQGNWYIDPALRSISPHLWQIGDLAARNGALVLCIGSDAGAIADATRKSVTRSRLYEEGVYKPKRFVRLWSRLETLSFTHNAELS